MELTGNVAGIIKLLGGGEGSDVTIEPLVTSGLQIAKVTIDEEVLYLYIPTPQDVDVDAVLTSGTKIADIKVNDDTIALYAPAPTSVNVSQVLTEGTKIATIGVNGVSTDLYAPESGEIIYSLTERKIGKFLDQDLYAVTVDFGEEISFVSDWNLTSIAHQNKYNLIFDGELISNRKLAYNVDIACNDTTYVEIRPYYSCVGRYLHYKYTKNS